MKKVIFLFLFIGSSFLFSSCDDDSGRNCIAIGIDLLELLDDFTDAQALYDNDPSPENCATLKAVLEEYIDLSIEGRKCVDEADLPDYDNNIDTLQDELASLPC